MLNERLKAAATIAPPLKSAKADAAQALSSGSSLMTALLEARKAAGVKPMVGQEVIEEIAAGNALVAKALGHYVEGHRKLAIVRDECGLRERMSGDSWECPEIAEQVDEPHRLRIVG